eukprot:Lithocolla_globosa_v1_NODE_10267_length_617_cov_3.606762.p1 type:complete len:201 gc:universal NODE_10267_length_617_cov_3.606762:616-14(-)
MKRIMPASKKSTKPKKKRTIKRNELPTLIENKKTNTRFIIYRGKKYRVESNEDSVTILKDIRNIVKRIDERRSDQNRSIRTGRRGRTGKLPHEKQTDKQAKKKEEEDRKRKEEADKIKRQEEIENGHEAREQLKKLLQDAQKELDRQREIAQQNQLALVPVNNPQQPPQQPPQPQQPQINLPPDGSVTSGPQPQVGTTRM